MLRGRVASRGESPLTAWAVFQSAGLSRLGLYRFPLVKPVRGWGSPAGIPIPWFLSERFVNPVPNINLRVFLLYVISYISV